MRSSSFKGLVVLSAMLLAAGGSVLMTGWAADAVAADGSADGIPVRPPEELDELLAPIALYPDALVALILPASTMPDDVGRAAAFLQSNNDPAQAAGQPWDPSIQALAHYPEVLRWMADNMDWTQQIGEAFSVQPSDVMKSIQQLRARAIAAGSLVSTAEQQVLTDGGEIRIVPAQPNVIYVPRYDADVVYEVVPDYAGPRMVFGAGFATGAWLAYDLNWDSYGIWVGSWRPGFDYRHPAWRRGYRGPTVVGRAWQPSRPPVHHTVWPYDPNRHRPDIARPHLFPGAPPRPPGFPTRGVVGQRPGGSPAAPVTPRGSFRDNNNYRSNPRGYPAPQAQPISPPAPGQVPAPSPNFGRGDRGGPPPASRAERDRTPATQPQAVPVPAVPDRRAEERRADEQRRAEQRQAQERQKEERRVDPVVPVRPPQVIPPAPQPIRPAPTPQNPAPIRPAPVPPQNQNLNPVRPPQPQNPNFFDGYHRGSDARDASQRGQSSRHPEPAPTPRAAPPAQQQQQPQPRQAAPPPAPQPQAPPASPGQAPQQQQQPDDQRRRGPRGN